MATLRVQGTMQVLQGFDNSVKMLGAGVNRGLIKAGLLLQGASQLLVPVDYGILKASAYTRATGSDFKTVVNVGYTAAYAIVVHENVAMAGRGFPRDKANPSRGNYWDPAGRGQAKFLEQPMRSMGPQFIEAVKSEIIKTGISASGTP